MLTKIAPFIGQWSPVAGTGFAFLGSLYLLVADYIDKVKKEKDTNASSNDGGEPNSPGQRSQRPSPNSTYSQNMQEVGTNPFTESSQDATTAGTRDLRSKFPNGVRRTSSELVPSPTRPDLRQGDETGASRTGDGANRRRVAAMLTKFDNFLGTAGSKHFDDSEFKRPGGQARRFPELPGEIYRNPALPQIREQYNEKATTEHHEHIFRAGSFVDIASEIGIGGSSTTPRAPSHQPRRLLHSPRTAVHVPPTFLDVPPRPE